MRQEGMDGEEPLGFGAGLVKNCMKFRPFLKKESACSSPRVFVSHGPPGMYWGDRA